MRACRLPFSPTLRGLIGITLLALGLARSAFAQVDQILPPMGGGGGGQYIARCQQGDLLNGFELHTGDDVDGIRPICVIGYSATAVGPRNIFPRSFGGPGGTVRQIMCPDNAPLVSGLEVAYEGEDTRIINNVHLYCTPAAVNQPLPVNPTVVFDGPSIRITAGGPFTGGDPVFMSYGKQNCPAGLVSVGISGRSGIWLDAVGLICGRLYLDTSKAPIGLGRVNSSAPAGPRKPLCEAAADARARNSPAAPNLEAQCRASQTPVKSLGRVNVAAAPGAPAAPRTLCQAAYDARARSSPAAPNLEAQCRATGGTPSPVSPQDLDALAAVGRTIATMDPVIARARTAEPDGTYWRGYDIATGVFGDPALGAKGNTATGPGSLGMRATLNAAGQRGFDASVSLHLSRNYKLNPTVPVGLPPQPPQAQQQQPPAAVNPAGAAMSSMIVISQIFGGGGNAGGALDADYVELLNRGDEPVSMEGWSLQYAAVNGATWNVRRIGGTILPGHYFLIRAPGPLPAADFQF
ncbi:MAG: lamin tail domain-containing protein, partial [Gammaproteobacteria bacterium]